jgi:hypothetical protein
MRVNDMIIVEAGNRGTNDIWGKKKRRNKNQEDGVVRFS